MSNARRAYFFIIIQLQGQYFFLLAMRMLQQGMKEVWMYMHLLPSARTSCDCRKWRKLTLCGSIASLMIKR